MFEKQKVEIRINFEQELQSELSKIDAKHKKTVAVLNNELDDMRKSNNNLEIEIQVFEVKLKEMHANMKKVLEAFQGFVDATPGFYKGQSEFVLQNLIPIGIEEFIGGK